MSPMGSDVSETAVVAAPSIDLVYFNAGGGHRAAARALEAQLAVCEPQWRVRLVDLFQVLDPEQRFRRLTGFAPETYYNKRLSTGFTLGLSQELQLLQAMIRVGHTQLVERLVRHWSQSRPDMVVSLVPNFNRALGDSARLALGHAPFVTVMTDLADHPPHFWAEPGGTGHLVCGTAHAYAQALSQGIAASRLHLVSGMMLAPGFYQLVSADRRDERRAHGLDPDSPVGLVMFGGHGSRAMKRIAMALANQPLILMCGRNEALRSQLEKLPAEAPRKVVGFTDDVAHWMRLADYFIGKPGPGSISEALHCGLPVILTRNAWTMPQERWNTQWVQEEGLGIVLPAFTRIETGVGTLLADLPGWREGVARLSNRAVFEVPRILRRLLASDHTAARGTGSDVKRGDLACAVPPWAQQAPAGGLPINFSS
jgi:1,2-diacylglycerol 3-beta-galactosyltransferase